MARKKQAQQLYVYMNGVLVGDLTQMPTGQLIFVYDHSWLNRDNTRPIQFINAFD